MRRACVSVHTNFILTLSCVGWKVMDGKATAILPAPEHEAVPPSFCCDKDGDDEATPVASCPRSVCWQSESPSACWVFESMLLFTLLTNPQPTNLLALSWSSAICPICCRISSSSMSCLILAIISLLVVWACTWPQHAWSVHGAMLCRKGWWSHQIAVNGGPLNCMFSSRSWQDDFATLSANKTERQVFVEVWAHATILSDTKT